MRPLLGLIAAALAAWTVHAQSPRPLPDADAFFKATEQNMRRAQEAIYSYKERRSELHTNPFGKLGTDGTRVYEVTPGPERGITYRRLLEEDGVKVENGRLERQDNRERTMSTLQAIDDVIDTLTFRMERREVADGRDVIVIGFAPQPDAHPQTRPGKIAKVFRGTIRVDEAAREVMRVDGTTIDSMSFGFGLIARLNEGTKVTLIRGPVDEMTWQPLSVRFVGEGRAMLFRKLTIDYTVEWFDYRRVGR